MKKQKSGSTTMYTCPMCEGVESNSPGKCTHCGMDLVTTTSASSMAAYKEPEHDSLLPLGIIIGLITLVSLFVTFSGGHYHESSQIHRFMQSFMAGFFIVFAGFKLLDLKGFAHGYASYDLLAKRSMGYGYVYPFIELALGLAYLTAFAPTATNVFTLYLMVFNAVGARLALRHGGKLRCACLGTTLKLPLTYVTIIEGVVMAGMAILMLLQV